MDLIPTLPGDHGKGSGAGASGCGGEPHQLGSALRCPRQLHGDQGNYVDAEPLYRRSLAIWEKALGTTRLILVMNCGTMGNW